MKKNLKYIIGCAAVAVLAFVVVSFSCTGKKDRGSANTAFAQTRSSSGTGAVNVSQSSLNIIEAMQDVNRAISRDVLPSVVELDVVETKKRAKNPFGDIPFFFFGTPRNDNNQEEYKEAGLGSGVIIRRNGNTFYVLTNNHVAGSATEISVKLNDGRKFDGKLVGSDSRMDIALVSFETSDKEIPLAVLGDSDSVQPGDICYAMGAPLGYSQSVTWGIVSATGRSGDGIGNINDFIQTDAAINQGNSGGPLLNIYGEVIGINTWIASTGTGGSVGLGFAIPINNVKSAIDSFIKNGKIIYGWVGVTLLEVSDDFKKDLGVDGIEGSFVSSVVIDSPAYKAGIKPGDYIVSLNSKKVKDSNQLVREIGYFEAGSTATIGVMRGGKRMPDMTVKVEERATAQEMQKLSSWPGFIAQPLTDSLREKLGVNDKKVRGVVISNIEEKSPAASLRLQDGDIITAVNGKSVKNLAEFYSELANATKSINFDVYSNGGTITTGSFKL